MNKNELIMLQSLPLELKIAKTKLRIEEFVRQVGAENTYISFSGGKDSTVLLHLVRSLFPNITAVFSDTGLEFPEIRKFVHSKENVVILKPKLSFKQVIEKYGYPVITKKTSKMIESLQKPTERNIKSRKLYMSDFRLDKDGNETDKPNKTSKIAKKWLKFIDSDIPVSNKCCYYLKESPIQKWSRDNDKRAIVGTMAHESSERELNYLKTGCNNFSQGKEKCTPLGFWRESDILEYIVKYDLDYCSVYGDIIRDNETGDYKTTGERRTGCVFCGFGIHLEDSNNNRMIRLSRSHPQLHKYCLDTLGFRKVYEFMGVRYE